MNLLAGVHVFSFQLLADILLKLVTLCIKLNLDPDIQVGLRQLVATIRAYVSDYKTMITSEGKAVLAQSKVLAYAVKRTRVNVKKMSQCIASLREIADAISANVFAVQADSINITELCKSRKIQHELTISNNQALVAELQKRISSLESEISSCEADIAQSDNGAEELDKRAHTIDKEAESNTKGGISWMISGITGLVSTPVKGKAHCYEMFIKLFSI